MVGLVNQPSEAYFVQIMHWTKLGKLDMMPNHIKTWQRRCWLQVLFSCPQVFLLLPCPKNDGPCSRWRLMSMLPHIDGTTVISSRHLESWLRTVPTLRNIKASRTCFGYYTWHTQKRRSKELPRRSMLEWETYLAARGKHPCQQPEFIKAHSKQTSEQMRGLVAWGKHWYSQSTATVWVRNTEAWLYEPSIGGSSQSTARVPVSICKFQWKAWFHEASIHGSSHSTARMPVSEWEAWLRGEH